MMLFLNGTASTPIYTLSLHDALPISTMPPSASTSACPARWRPARRRCTSRSEEHTSELQSRQYLVCRLLLEKKKLARQRMLAALRAGGAPRPGNAVGAGAHRAANRRR